MCENDTDSSVKPNLGRNTLYTDVYPHQPPGFDKTLVRSSFLGKMMQTQLTACVSELHNSALKFTYWIITHTWYTVYTRAKVCGNVTTNLWPDCWASYSRFIAPFALIIVCSVLGRLFPLDSGEAWLWGLCTCWHWRLMRRICGVQSVFRFISKVFGGFEMCRTLDFFQSNPCHG